MRCWTIRTFLRSQVARSPDDTPPGFLAAPRWKSVQGVLAKTLLPLAYIVRLQAPKLPGARIAKTAIPAMLTSISRIVTLGENEEHRGCHGTRVAASSAS
jgi:hypothetical protein